MFPQTNWPRFRFASTLTLFLGLLLPVRGAPIHPERPRTLYEPDRMERMLRRASQNTREWQNFSAYTDRFLSAGTAVSDMQARGIRGLALKYQLGKYAAEKRVHNPVSNYRAYGKRAAALTYEFLTKSMISIADIGNSAAAVVTTARPHGLATGATVILFGGTSARPNGWSRMNSVYRVTVLDAEHFTIACPAPWPPYLGNYRENACSTDTSEAGPFADGGEAIRLYAMAAWGTVWYQINFLRGGIPEVLYAYDWVYDFFTPQQRADMVPLIAYLSEAHTRNIYVGGNCGPAEADGNLCAGEMRGAALAATVLAGDYPRAQDRFDFVRKLFQSSETGKNSNIVVPLLTVGAAKGGYHKEGVEYGAETLLMYGEYCDIVKRATGEDIEAFIPNYRAEQMYRYIYDQSPAPSGWDARGNPAGVFEPLTEHGDVEPDKRRRYTVWHRVAVNELLAHFVETGQTTLAGYARWWRDRISPSSDYTPVVYSDFADYDPFVPAVDYTKANLPLTYFAGSSHLVARSDWSEAAMHVNFLAHTQTGDHVHCDSGQFEIYRKGRFLAHETQGYGGAYTSSALHNTLLINGLGSNSGRAGPPATIDREEASPDGSYVYGEANLGPAYAPTMQPGSIEEARRRFLYLRRLDTVVVIDSVRYCAVASRGCPQGAVLPHGGKTWWALNSDAASAVDGGNLTIRSGNQSLHVTAVEPAEGHWEVHSNAEAAILAVDTGSVTRILLDVPHNLPAARQLTIQGATGAWAVLNGNWTATRDNSAPWARSVAYTIPVDTGAVRVPWNGRHATSTVLNWNNGREENLNAAGFRSYLTTGTASPSQAFFVVLRAADTGARDMPVSRLVGTGLTAARIGSVVVADRRTAGIKEISYDYPPDAVCTHIVTGMDPSAAYSVDRTRPGHIQITAGREDASTLHATNAGVLTWNSAGSACGAPQQ